MSLDEKQEIAVEHVKSRPPSSGSSAIGLPDGELLAQDIRPSAERRLVRILDMRLLPTIILIFIMNYIDVSTITTLPLCWILTGLRQRVAVTSARLKGLTEDLNLTGVLSDRGLLHISIVY